MKLRFKGYDNDNIMIIIWYEWPNRISFWISLSPLLFENIAFGGSFLLAEFQFFVCFDFLECLGYKQKVEKMTNGRKTISQLLYHRGLSYRSQLGMCQQPFYLGNVYHFFLSTQIIWSRIFFTQSSFCNGMFGQDIKYWEKGMCKFFCSDMFWPSQADSNVLILNSGQEKFGNSKLWSIVVEWLLLWIKQVLILRKELARSKSGLIKRIEKRGLGPWNPLFYFK